MSASTETHTSPSVTESSSLSSAAPAPLAKQSHSAKTPFQLVSGTIESFKEKRRRRRVAVTPMYTEAKIRILASRSEPLVGHVINLSETGMMVELDEMIAAGQAITIEFSVAGLGTERADCWPTFAIAGEVVRMDDLDDFPQGPYHIGLRFVRIPTMVQAQIARYILTQR